MVAALAPNARLLLVRMGALGDIVHALPVLSALRRHRPDVAVDWLVDARYAGVLDLVEGLAHRVVVRAAADSVRPGAVHFAGIPGIGRAIGWLRRRRYAAALDLQGLIKSAVLARASGAGRVLGFERRALREAQAAWAYTDAVAVDDRGHVVHKNLALLRPLAVPDAGVTFPWAAPTSAVVPSVCGDARVASAGGFVLLNPGAAWENKRWPVEHFGALAQAIGERHGLPSVVTWGPGEQPRADAVVAHANGHALVSPPTTLADMLALAQAARLCVSGDTGPLHLAASVGTPLVGLFGPTRPERNGPWLAADVSVSRAGACVCFHKRQCLEGQACIDRIAVAEVLEACSTRLAVGRVA